MTAIFSSIQNKHLHQKTRLSALTKEKQYNVINMELNMAMSDTVLFSQGPLQKVPYNPIACVNWSCYEILQYC